MKTLLLTSTLALALLTGCSTTSTTPPEVEPPIDVTPEATPDTSPETDLDFVIPDEYALLDATIAAVFSSVQNMPDYVYIPNSPIDGQILGDMFGISEDLYTDFHGEASMMNTQPDMLLLFKTEDTDALADLLNQYLEQQRADGTQYPSTLDKLSMAEVGIYEDFVYLNMLSSYPENEASYDHTEIMNFYKETTAQVTAEIERILGGGTPNPPRQLTGGIPQDNEDEHLGEYQEPSGDPSDFVVDENDLTPATPGEGELPEIGLPTEGHAPANIPNTRPTT